MVYIVCFKAVGNIILIYCIERETETNNRKETKNTNRYNSDNVVVYEVIPNELHLCVAATHSFPTVSQSKIFRVLQVI